MFSQAIVKRPCRRMIQGLSTAGLGVPDFKLAQKQHDAYIKALIRCGLDVTILPAQDEYPDSVFIEDTAVLTPTRAVITRPGAPSRLGEIEATAEAVSRFYSDVERITAPGCLDGGDVMNVGNHYYIGLSERTNTQGAEQLTAILKRHGMTASTIDLASVLHLKTGVVYIEHDTFVLSGEFIEKEQFARSRRILVDPDESYAANSIWVNDRVLIAKGFPTLRRQIESLGYPTLELDMSEYRKLDGGLSCLSLRF